MNITGLNMLMIRNDSKNRLPRGRRCYDEGLVLEIKSMADDEYSSLDIYGKVMSESDISVYDTNISIDMKNDVLIYTECNCVDFGENCDFNSNYICKHIGATFYKFTDIVEDKIKSTQEQVLDNDNSNLNVKVADYAESLLKEIDNISSGKKEKVNLEINLTGSKYGSAINHFEVDFKIGTKKMYVVKNVIELIDAIKKGKELSYGKEFVFNSEKHYFAEDDRMIIEFLEECASLNEAVEYRYQMSRYSHNIFGKNKTILVSQAALRRFLQCAKNHKINFCDKDVCKLVEVVINDLPITFSINENEEGINLCSNENIPISLTYKGDVYYYNDKLYLPSEEQLKYYKTFNAIFNNCNNVIFKGKHKQEVFNKVIPILETISSDINVDENLTKNIVRDTLAMEVLFDRERNATWAIVNVIYGDKKFNLLNGPKEDEYIIRDLKGESKIENALNKLHFFKDKEKFIFQGDDKNLFEFLRDDLKELKDIATLYYSDRFRERRIYGSDSISASVNEGKGNYLEFTFNIGGIDEKQLKSILKAFKENRKFFKLKDDSFVDLQENSISELLELVDDLSDTSDIKGNNFKVHKSKAMFLKNAIIEDGMSFINGKDIVTYIADKIDSMKEAEYEVPNELEATLRDYQLNGFRWFKTLSHYEFGGILADEMGLGKTLQTITFLLSEKNKKSIIVTPTSLIYNWKSEFDKFAPTIKVKVIHGSKDERILDVEDIGKYDVILTTYGTLRNDFELYENKQFDYCIIDEAQNIKNSQSLSSEAVKGISAKVKFALTGTPIENNLIELWSIFDFIMPGYLYSKGKFQEKFITKSKDLEKLKRLIKPFILRRLKKDVMKELPDKIEKKFFVEMTKDQKEIYASFVEDIKEKMEDKDVERDKITVFSYLTKLRQLCLDPSIIVEEYKGGSGKVDVVVELLHKSIEEGRKILLFSQFTSVLSSLKTVLETEGVGYYYLDGATKPSERVNMVQEFNSNNDIKVFLISLKAGGTGLNLTSADMVIHFDPWWNPAIEEQATDRAHRFGQKNVVEVVKLIAKGTIEEKILTLQESKKEIINEIMSGNYTNGSFLSNLNAEEIRELFL